MAVMHPTTEQFCARFNVLATSEFGSAAPLVLEPYTDQENPEYSPDLLAKKLDTGILPVATAPSHALHDQLHALVVQGVAEELQTVNNPRRLHRHFERALSLLALVGALDHPQRTDEWGFATATWRDMLDTSDNAVIYAALERIAERVRTTEQRFTRLGL